MAYTSYRSYGKYISNRTFNIAVLLRKKQLHSWQLQWLSLLIQCVALQILADVKFAHEYFIQSHTKPRNMKLDRNRLYSFMHVLLNLCTANKRSITKSIYVVTDIYHILDIIARLANAIVSFSLAGYILCLFSRFRNHQYIQTVRLYKTILCDIISLIWINDDIVPTILKWVTTFHNCDIPFHRQRYRLAPLTLAKIGQHNLPKN